MTNDCNYPNCLNCTKDDCDMEQKDIVALLKRRRYHDNVELNRKKQNEYRQKKRYELPKCNECSNCIVVKNEKRTVRIE